MYQFDDEPPVKEIPPDPPNRARALTYTSLCRGDEHKPYQRMNAFKHGMFAKHLLVPGDDPSELLRFKIGMIKCLNPNDTFQQMIAERIICASWKLRRMEQAEQEMYLAEVNDPQDPASSAGAAMVRLMKQSAAGLISPIERIQKYQQQLEGTITRNVRLLNKLQVEGWHRQGVISELCGELVEEHEGELKKIDPSFKPEVLGSGWQNTRDPIHECVERKKQQEEAEQAQSQGSEASIPAPAEVIATPESSDLLGQSKDFWNKVDVEDLKRRAKEKAANSHESTRIAS